MKTEELTLDDKLAQAALLIAGVKKCHNDPMQSDISDHYDCKSDLNEAIKLLDSAIEEL